ncbi:MAG: hypothetical protein ACLSIL_15965 [Enterococcus casseliflavus]
MGETEGQKLPTSLYAIRASVGTAVLIEDGGFIDSKRDMDILSGKMDEAVNAALKAMGYSTSSGGSSNGGGSTSSNTYTTANSKPCSNTKPADTACS